MPHAPSPLSPENIARIRESFAAQTMMTSLEATLDALGEGRCQISAPILEGFRQQHGFGHAALTFALGDTAAGYAALTRMGPTQEVLSAELKVNLLAPARGDRLRAEGQVLRAGRRLVTVEARVWAIDGTRETQIAAFLGTMVPVET